MAEVSYTDLNKYVIIHMLKWVDMRNGVIHRVEYRVVKYMSPGTGLYLEKWQDGAVQQLSIKELQTYVNLWKNDTEHNIPQQVVDELNNPTYEVVLQFQKNEGDVRNLVEIRKYPNDDHQLWCDRQFVKRMNPSEFVMEQTKKEQWEFGKSVHGHVACKMDSLLSKLASISKK
jgi:hypothetical protein